MIGILDTPVDLLALSLSRVNINSGLSLQLIRCMKYWCTVYAPSLHAYVEGGATQS